MKFIIKRASLSGTEFRGKSPQPHEKAKKEKWDDLTFWTIEINSLEELIEFIRNLPNDKFRTAEAYKPDTQEIIIEKNWLREARGIEDMPEWVIVIYDDFVE